jgi:hypothetical protein
MAGQPRGVFFPNMVPSKLSDEQVSHIDAARGSLSRSAYIRLLVVQDMRRKGRALGKGGIEPDDTPRA